MGFKVEAHKSVVFEDNCWTSWTQVKALNLGKQTCIKEMSQCTVYTVHCTLYWIVFILHIFLHFFYK